MAYETIVINTLEEYYSLYPQYKDAEDITAYPQLDPSIPTGQLVMGRVAEIQL